MLRTLLLSQGHMKNCKSMVRDSQQSLATHWQGTVASKEFIIINLGHSSKEALLRAKIPGHCPEVALGNTAHIYQVFLVNNQYD